MSQQSVPFFRRLRFRFFFLLLVSSLLLYVIIVAIIINRFRADSLQRAQYLTTNLATGYANSAVARMNVDMNLIRGFSIALKSAWQNNRQIEKNYYHNILRNASQENPEIMAVWINMELSAIDRGWNKNYGRERHTLVTLKGQEAYLVERLNLDGDDPQSDYYFLKQSKIFEFSEPYLDSYGSDPREYLMSSVCAPVLDDDHNFIGLVGFDFSLDRLTPFVEQLVPYSGTLAMVVSHKGLIVAHPNDDVRMKAVDEYMGNRGNGLLEKIEKGDVYFFEKEINGEDYFIAMAPILLSKSVTPWSLVLQIPKKQVMATVYSTMYLSIVICFIGLVLLASIIYFLTIRIEKPLIKCVDFADEIGKGNLTKSLKIDTGDEIGLLAGSLNTMAAQIREIVSAISDGAALLAQTSSQLALSSRELIDGASEQEYSSSQAEESIAQLSSYLNASVQSLQEASLLSAQTNKNVAASSGKFKTSVNSMKHIAEKIQVINDIAFQTNILALNAAVEAARAGNAGRGFAIVAGEVRRLADRSKEAAADIVSMATNTSRNNEEADATLNETFTQIGQYTTIVSAINEQATLQHESVEGVIDTIENLKNISQINNGHASRIDELASSLKKQSEKLIRLTTAFEIGK
jgi:methyl-accepting chemotaxis protein